MTSTHSPKEMDEKRYNNTFIPSFYNSQKHGISSTLTPISPPLVPPYPNPLIDNNPWKNKD